MVKQGSQDSLICSLYGLPLKREGERGAGGGRGGFLILTNSFSATANDFSRSIGSHFFFSFLSFFSQR